MQVNSCRTTIIGLCFVLFSIGVEHGHTAKTEPLSPPTILHVASERHTSLALNYAYFPQFARLGFGTSSEPWHPWFGTREMQVLLYLPDYKPGQDVEISPRTMLGSRFGGKKWANGFDALRSFDADQNGLVERDELNPLYVWSDYNSNGLFDPWTTQEPGDSLQPCRTRYAGFDLRKSLLEDQGYARQGLRAPFAVILHRGSRIHLLDLAIQGAFAERYLGYLSYADSHALDPENAFSGQWTWMVNSQTWTDAHKTWRQGTSGRLLLAARDQIIRGVVQYQGQYFDHINLPLKGKIDGHKAQWTSVSPLGLTRSQVTLSQEYGQPVLHGTAWSNRNGKLQRWTWKAYYETHLK